ncbi:unnamed protein product [Mytilus edulis]|uniref:Uncharacterized protein n=1 Tax=Mytilus edulis TaxID=6550 RepID=A0A8S3U3Q6_MYTED|nr:unnamed protein product [Mytilus edulis]
MELFENTKNFPKENVDYLKYRLLFSRTPLNGPPGKLYKPTSVLSLLSQQEQYISQSHFPAISQQINLTSGNQSHRETQSAPKNIENRVRDSTELESENEEENQQMSHSANKGSKNLNCLQHPTGSTRQSCTDLHHHHGITEIVFLRNVNQSLQESNTNLIKTKQFQIDQLPSISVKRDMLFFLCLQDAISVLEKDYIVIFVKALNQ